MRTTLKHHNIIFQINKYYTRHYIPTIHIYNDVKYPQIRFDRLIPKLNIESHDLIHTYTWACI